MSTPDPKPVVPSDVKVDKPLWVWYPPHKGTKRKSLGARAKARATYWHETRDEYWWVNPTGVAKLPPRRHTRTKFTYRQFLNLLWQQSELYVAAQVGLAEKIDPTEVAEKASFQLREMRRQVKTSRAFAKLVLGGGPDGVWMGKSLRPDTVHEQVCAFAASGQPGFDASIVGASSQTWEMYKADPYSVEDYASFKERKDLPHLLESGKTMKQITRQVAKSESLLTRVDAEAVREHMPEGQLYDGVGAELAKKIVDPLSSVSGTVDPATGEIKQVRCNFVYTPEVMEAMGSTMIHRNVREGSQCTHVAVSGTVRCELHGGLYASPEETRRLVIASQMKMFNLADQAVSTIADIMLHGATEASRLRAAETILNRSGITEGSDFEMPALDGKQSRGDDASDKIKRRLQKLAEVTDEDLERIREESAQRQQRHREGEQAHEITPDHDVVEGEIVEAPDPEAT